MGNGQLQCPCCRHDIAYDDVADFQSNMKALETSPQLVTVDDDAKDRILTLKTKYNEWRVAIQESMGDVRDYRRIVEECKELEAQIGNVDAELALLRSELSTKRSQKGVLDTDLNEIGALLSAAQRWAEEAARIHQKENEIEQNKQTLEARTGDSGRDLKAVESDITARTNEKEGLSDKIHRWNKEMAMLNDTITNLSSQAARAEGEAKHKEDNYAKEQKSSIRRRELHDLLRSIAEDETNVSQYCRLNMLVSFILHSLS